MSTVSAVSATFSSILLCLEADLAWKYIVAIFHKFSAMGMRFRMQSMKVLKITRTNVDVFHGIGHFRTRAHVLIYAFCLA